MRLILNKLNKIRSHTKKRRRTVDELTPKERWVTLMLRVNVKPTIIGSHNIQ